MQYGFDDSDLTKVEVPTEERREVEENVDGVGGKKWRTTEAIPYRDIIECYS
jgi:hypothetical protein